MRSFGSALVVLTLAVGALSAQTGAGGVPSTLAAQVSGLVARLWAQDSAAVTLEWGRLPANATFPAGTSVKLVGRGESGWLGVIFTRHAGSSLAARVHAG